MTNRMPENLNCFVPEEISRTANNTIKVIKATVIKRVDIRFISCSTRINVLIFVTKYIHCKYDGYK